jgi:stage V sporulation protein SpoVS
MTVTGTATHGLRLESLDSLSGNIGLEASASVVISESIDPATDDENISAALGVCTKADLIAFAFRANQDGLVRLRGGNPFLLATVATVGDLAVATGGTITIAGDLVDQWYPGDMIFIKGCTTPANDGLYVVHLITEAAGVTTIECYRVTGAINVAVVEVFDTAEAGAGAANFCTKVVPYGRRYYIDAGDDFTVAGAPGQIEIAEDLSFLQEHDQILITESTTAATNDNIFTVVSATYAAPDTTLVVEEAVVVEAGNGACTLQPVVTEFRHRLVANEPTVWHKWSGILNPVLEDLSVLEASNSHATADMLLEGLILRVPV